METKAKKTATCAAAPAARTGVDLKKMPSPRAPAQFLKVLRAITEAALAFPNLHAATAALEAPSDKVAAYCADKIRQAERTINN